MSLHDEIARTWLMFMLLYGMIVFVLKRNCFFNSFFILWAEDAARKKYVDVGGEFAWGGSHIPLAENQELKYIICNDILRPLHSLTI